MLAITSALGGLLRRIVAAAVLAVTAALATGCAAEPPPVSEKVQKYYDDSQTKQAQAMATMTATAGPVRKVAFIGDSYSAGTGTTSEAKRWTSLLSRSLNWTEINLARGGTGYLATQTANAKAACGLAYCPSYLEMVPKVIAAKPDIVIVSGGRNDGAEATAPLVTNIQAVYTELRKGLPKAKIIAFSPIWGAEGAPADADGFASVIAESVASVKGNYLNIGQPYRGRGDLITNDNVHPNDAGHAELAGVAAASIKSAGIR